MTTRYFNNAVNTSWDTLGNWWLDAAFSTPSTSIPVNGDTVFIGANLDTGPSVAVTLPIVNVADASTGGGSFAFSGLELAVIGVLNTYDGSYINGGNVTATTWNSYNCSNNQSNVTATTWNSYNYSNNQSNVYATTWNSYNYSYNYSNVYATTWNSHDSSNNQSTVNVTTWNSHDSSNNNAYISTGSGYNNGNVTTTTWNSYDSSNNSGGSVTTSTWNSYDSSYNSHDGGVNDGYVGVTTWNSYDNSLNSSNDLANNLRSTVGATTWNSYGTSYNNGNVYTSTTNFYSITSVKQSLTGGSLNGVIHILPADILTTGFPS